jgi:hypothetical protein
LRDGEFRETQSLNVEGCLGSNYRDTFYQLQDIRSDDPPAPHSCIFYGELRFRSRPNYDSPEHLILTLNRGIRSDGNRELRLYRLIIRWQDWREQLKALFVKEVETKRLATNKRYDARGLDRSRPFISDIIVYFLGQQVQCSPTDFEVSDYRKVAIVMEPNGLYRDYPNHSFLKKASPKAEPSQPPRSDSPKAQRSPQPAQPPSSVTLDFTTPVSPPKPRQPEQPIAPRPPVTREQPPAQPIPPLLQPNPTATEHYRPFTAGENTPTVAPPRHPESKPRPGFLDWLKSLFG